MITLSHICFSYHRKKVLEDLSLSIAPGTCVALVGNNGCGKSTLLSIIAGIRKPISGSYLLNGKTATSKSIRQMIGYIPQDNPLIPDLTVKDNLKLWYSQSSYSYISDMKDGILAMLHLDEFLHVPVSRLSGGMKKRVSFAIALSSHPRLLILDEPSTALDLVCKKEIHTYLESFKKQGGTILFTTHEEQELNLCDKLYVFRNGTLRELPVTSRGDTLLGEITLTDFHKRIN